MIADQLDILTEAGLRTGETLSRAEVHRLGKPHRAVHVYIMNSANEVLLQRRALTVDHLPGVFAISVTGHVNAGETSSEAARREVQEELGLDSQVLRLDFLFSFFQEARLHETYLDKQFNDVYLVRAEVDLDTLRLDPSEVSEVKFVPFREFQDMVANQTSDLAPVYRSECRDLVYFLRGPE